MGLLDLFRGPGLDRGVEEYRSTPGALLLDVRTLPEFREGHVPGALNLPLQELDRIGQMVPEKSTPLFLYCRSGARSGQAAEVLEGRGYTCVKNIGGIISYKGKVER